MAFGSFGEGGPGMPMAEINTTPLVDVMLVLLVIFIITAPLFQQAVPVDLPRVAASRLDEKPQVLRVSLDGAGRIHLDGAVLDLTAFEARCQEAAQAQGSSELHLHAERTTPYEEVTRLMAAAQRAGLQKIAFVTDPGAQAPAR